MDRYPHRQELIDDSIIGRLERERPDKNVVLTAVETITSTPIAERLRFLDEYVERLSHSEDPEITADPIGTAESNIAYCCTALSVSPDQHRLTQALWDDVFYLRKMTPHVNTE